MNHTSLCERCKLVCRRKSNKPKAFQPTYGAFARTGAGTEIESPIGDGESLQSISIIKQRLGAIKQDAPELKFLHSVIFGNEGETKSRKKMLLEFKGLSGGSAASTDAVCDHFCLGLNCNTSCKTTAVRVSVLNGLPMRNGASLCRCEFVQPNYCQSQAPRAWCQLWHISLA